MKKHKEVISLGSVLLMLLMSLTLILKSESKNDTANSDCQCQIGPFIHKRSTDFERHQNKK